MGGRVQAVPRYFDLRRVPGQATRRLEGGLKKRLRKPGMTAVRAVSAKKFFQVENRSEEKFATAPKQAPKIAPAPLK